MSNSQKRHKDFMDRIRVKAALWAYVAAVGENILDFGRGDGPDNTVQVGFSELEKAIQDMLIDEDHPGPVYVEDIQLKPSVSRTEVSVTIKLSSGAYLGCVIDTAIAMF